VFLIAISGGLSDPLYVYGIVTLYILSFFMVNWSEYYTHKAITRVGELGVTELQYLCMSFLLFTGVMGYGIGEIELSNWLTFLPKGFTVGRLIFWGIASSTPYNLWFTMSITTPSLEKGKESAAFIELLPMLHVALAMFLFALVREYDAYKGFVLVGLGIYNSLIICKFIISGLSKMHYNDLQVELMVPTVLGA